MKLAQFAFIVIVPIVIAAGAIVSLFAVGALFDALDNPTQASASIVSAFKAKPVAGKLAGANHYYKPYWK